MQTTNPELRILSPSAACFDGTLERPQEKELLEWAKMSETGVQKSLVIRSRGGDAETGITFAEQLQLHETRIFIYEVCASSCANYIFTPAHERHVIGEALILFHGGFSDKVLRTLIVTFDNFISSPEGKLISDPVANKQEVINNFEIQKTRQNELFRKAGVSEDIINIPDSLDLSEIPYELCKDKLGQNRDFIFFNAGQMQKMGISVATGSVIEDPQIVNDRMGALGVDFSACLSPKP